MAWSTAAVRRKNEAYWKMVYIILIIVMTMLSACGNRDVSSSSVPKEATSSESEQMTAENNEDVVEGANVSNIQHDLPQAGMTEAVPSQYLTALGQQGSVVRVEYNSKDYVRDGSPVTKEAYVYLPYGYDENDMETRYNIIYLIHGMGGRAGEFFDFENNRNMFDHLIGNGDIPPSIIVAATFYTENSSTDFSGSIRELREFHQDFANDLMPAIEGQFHTYAMSTSPEDLVASRDHRAFGGFSLGSVTTWMEFCYDYDYIRYFLPMSGSCWYYGSYGNYYPVETCDFFEKLIEENNLSERGYFIYAATGTQDVVRDQMEIQMEEMLNRSDVFTSDHVMYYQKQDGRHDLKAVQEYLFNALPLFFRE